MTITGRIILASLLANSVVAQNLRQLQVTKTVAPQGTEAKHPATVDGVPGTPTKSPSSGVHKPTWYDPFIIFTIYFLCGNKHV